MNIVVIADDPLREELLAQKHPTEASVEFFTEIPAGKKADCYIDLLYEWSAERTDRLRQLDPALIIVNAVAGSLDHLPPGTTRINAWPTFLKRAVVEASGLDEDRRKKTEAVFACFGKTVEWVPNVNGFISPRVVSMIINEAYYTLDEKVSTKEEIDIAMKAGTNYPYGPFEWSRLIGLKKVYALLHSLSVLPRYTVSALLEKEALNA